MTDTEIRHREILYNLFRYDRTHEEAMEATERVMKGKAVPLGAERRQ